GRDARARARIDARQPLARAVLVARGVSEVTAEFADQLARLLNVRSVEFPRPDLVPHPWPGSEGWAVAADGGDVVALDIAMTPEVGRDGLAARAKGAIRAARRESLAPGDGITLWWKAATEELSRAMPRYAPQIPAEVDAAEYVEALDAASAPPIEG